MKVEEEYDLTHCFLLGEVCGGYDARARFLV